VKYRRQAPLALALLLSYAPPAWSEAPAALHADAQVEIHYLLDFVEISGCEFYRNGTWYDSEQARGHLRTKYENLSARNRIHSAEDFILLAASKSSMSGKPYEIRCGDCATSATGNWLTGVLMRYRTVGARGQVPE